jgi:hypothetical protein
VFGLFGAIFVCSGAIMIFHPEPRKDVPWDKGIGYILFGLIPLSLLVYRMRMDFRRQEGAKGKLKELAEADMRKKREVDRKRQVVRRRLRAVNEKIDAENRQIAQKQRQATQLFKMTTSDIGKLINRFLDRHPQVERYVSRV